MLTRIEGGGRRRFSVPALLTALLGACSGPLSTDPGVLARLPERVDFNHHVQPLLSDRCYACHGPDEAARKAGLRLDLREGLAREAHRVRAPAPSSRAACAGAPCGRRSASEDPQHRMPPPESKLELSEYEKALIGRWIEQGGEWKPHWAFIVSRAPRAACGGPRGTGRGTPSTTSSLARLEREGLEPTREADRERLIRRVSFDLRGLPPTLEEIDAFLADESEDAYERLVERFLDSPAHAERMALDWLDLARYADSHGLHADGYRYMWPWRDWVIGAFEENLQLRPLPHPAVRRGPAG